MEIFLWGLVGVFGIFAVVVIGFVVMVFVESAGGDSYREDDWGVEDD